MLICIFSNCIRQILVIFRFSYCRFSKRCEFCRSWVSPSPINKQCREEGRKTFRPFRSVLLRPLPFFFTLPMARDAITKESTTAPATSTGSSTLIFRRGVDYQRPKKGKANKHYSSVINVIISLFYCILANIILSIKSIIFTDVLKSNNIMFTVILTSF